MNNGTDVLLHLSLIESVGTQTLRIITSLMKNESDLKTIYEWDAIVWQRLGFSEKKAKTIVSGLRKKDLLEDEKLDYPTQIDHLNYLLDF
jgi:hypothetical protein